MFRVLLGLWAFYVERAELTTAQELAEQLSRLAQQVESRTMLTWAHLTRGITLHFTGEQPAARQLHVPAEVRLHPAVRATDIDLRFGGDGGHGVHPLLTR